MSPGMMRMLMHCGPKSACRAKPNGNLRRAVQMDVSIPGAMNGSGKTPMPNAAWTGVSPRLGASVPGQAHSASRTCAETSGSGLPEDCSAISTKIFYLREARLLEGAHMMLHDRARRRHIAASYRLRKSSRRQAFAVLAMLGENRNGK